MIDYVTLKLFIFIEFLLKIFRYFSKSVFGKSETNVESEEYAREKTRKMRKVKQEGELKFFFRASSRFFAGKFLISKQALRIHPSKISCETLLHSKNL